MNLPNPTNRWLIGGLIALGAIALLEAGIILSGPRTATGEKTSLLARLLPDRWMPAAASGGPAQPHKDRIVLLESEQDLDAIHEQINRLFSAMAASGGPAPRSLFGSAAIRPARTPWTDHMLKLQHEVDRIFQDAFNDTDLFSLPVQLEQGWNLCAVASPIRLEDQGSNLLVQLELPGVEASAIAINLQGRLLTITASRDQPSEDSGGAPAGGHAQSQQFSSKLMLPGAVDGNAARASYQGGLLRIALPKHADQAPPAKTIQITQNSF